MLKKLLLILAAAVSAQGFVLGAEYTQADIDSGKVLANLSKTAYENAMSRLGSSTSGCNKANVKVRKEWRNMPAADRIAYRKAIECIMEQKSVYTDAPGAKSTWDDFGVLHYKQTPYTHYSATFLLWHRYYIQVLEDNLRDKCGYQGTMPYWEWGLDCADVDKSPVFDGSETSLGSNGEFIGKHRAIFGAGGTGGGCVKKGPFANYTVNIGPVEAADPLKYNPRCLKRDLNGDICSKWASLRNATDPILNSKNIEVFQAVLQADGRVPEARSLGLALHGGGHYTISGDPGGDFYFSPLEPGFYLHHGQLDRLHFIWQNLDWKNRQTIAGTNTMYNQPPSANATLDDIQDMAPLGGNRTLRELMDTIGGTPHCYVYE
ncbi:hypothetical protein QBC46DRAFT_421335 [Diplogelasinospora grovesii]|uniref:Tyrosinase copper-binding domain-containing protein n=1 Tax=Diplogelasinospora grovesii TaxID=303347 RepID=A0AAN6S0X7_9PEZI|nr:hypothetical protein QBC46DRAFT_421335 [Diplogelasinospora grovesii]